MDKKSDEKNIYKEKNMDKKSDKKHLQGIRKKHGQGIR